MSDVWAAASLKDAFLDAGWGLGEATLCTRMTFGKIYQLFMIKVLDRLEIQGT